MSEHTPEPWGSLDGKIIGNVSQNGETGDLVTDCGWYTKGKADARRIVACVNALKGVKTESLEEAVALGISDVTTGNLFSSRLKLTRERDEARAMAAELAKALTDQHWALVHDNIIVRHGHKNEDDFEIHEREHPNCPHCALLAKALLLA